MHEIIDWLDKIVFKILPDSPIWNTVRIIWEGISDIGWEELYIISLREVVEKDEKDRLIKYTHDGDVTIVCDTKIIRLLHQNIRELTHSISNLSDQEFINLLVDAFIKNEIIIIGGNNLSHDDYKNIIFNLIHKTNEKFREKVQASEKRFKEALLREANSTRVSIQEIISTLNILNISILDLYKIKEEINHVNDSLSRRPVIFLCTPGYELESVETDVEYYLKSMNYRVLRLSSSIRYGFNSTIAVSNDILSSSIFIGIFANRYGDLINVTNTTREPISWARFAFNSAISNCKRCIMFEIGENYSSLRFKEPEPPKEEHRPGPIPKIKDIEPQPITFTRKETVIVFFQQLLSRITKRNYNKLLEQKNNDEIERRQREVKRLSDEWECRKKEWHKLEDSYKQKKEVHEKEVTEQEKFLGEISSYYPAVPLIESFEHLIQLLTTSINQIEAKNVTGYSSKAVLKQWTDWGSRIENELREYVLFLRPSLPSSLDLYLPQFIETSWIKDVNLMRDQLHHKAINICVDFNIPQEKKFLDYDNGLHPTQWGKKAYVYLDWGEIVENYILGELEKKESEAKRVEKPDKKYISKINNRIEDFSHSAHELNKCVASPQFSKCLLIFGKMGSGKTHFMANLLKNQANDDSTYICLPFDKDQVFTSMAGINSYENWKQQFDALILNRASLSVEGQLRNIEWRSIEELNDFVLMKMNRKLLVVFDDFDQWIVANEGLLKKLKRYIASNAHLEGIKWIFLIPENNYVLVSDNDGFWEQYGYQSELIDALHSSWISLDEINRKQKRKILDSGKVDVVENPILKQVIQSYFRGNEKYEEITLLLNPESLQLLSIPFIAWTACEFIEKNRKDDIYKSQLPNLRYLDFVRIFWDKRQEEYSDSLKLAGFPLDRELDHVISYISENMIRKGSLSFYKQKAQTDLQNLYGMKSKLQDMDISEKLLDFLLDKDILVRSKLDSNSLSLGFPLFWEYHGGSILAVELNQKTGNSDILDKVLTERYGEFGTIKEHDGVFEFALLFIDDNNDELITPTDKSFIPIEISKIVFEKYYELKPSIWLFAAKASPINKFSLFRWVLDNIEQVYVTTKEEVQNLLFFVRHTMFFSDDHYISWAMRFELLRNFYGLISQYSLDDYFYKYIFNEFNPVDCDDLMRGVANLYGIEDSDALTFSPERIERELMIERLSVPYEISEWFFVGKNFYGNLSVKEPDLAERSEQISIMVQEVSAIIKYLKAHENYSTRKLLERDRIWGCVIGCYCEQVISDKGTECFDWFENQGLFLWKDKLKLDYMVFMAIEEHITTSFGRWYRQSKGIDNEYVNLVERFASHEGTIKARDAIAKKRIAIFLIYHSVPKNEQNQSINEDLLKILERLHEDPAWGIKILWERVAVLSNFYDLQRNYMQ